MSSDSELVPSLGALRVLDEHGSEVVVRDLWRDRTAVLVLVRHFGCLFCQEQVAELTGQEDEIVARGARLVVIGNGAPTFIAGFRDRVGFDGLLYTDPTRRVYAALGMTRRLRSSFNLRTLRQALRAYRSGHRQGAVQGDPWQQGGVAIVSPSGERVFEYRSAFAGDHPPVADLLRALRGRRAA